MPLSPSLSLSLLLLLLLPPLVLLLYGWVMAARDSAKSLGLTALVWFELNKEVDWRLETDVSVAIRSAIDRASAPALSVSKFLHHSKERTQAVPSN